jgi:hypothetical protein
MSSVYIFSICCRVTRLATSSARVMVLVLAWPEGSILKRTFSLSLKSPAPISSLPSSDFLLPSVYRIVAGLHFRTEGGRMSKLLPCMLAVGPTVTTSLLGPWRNSLILLNIY